MDASVSESGPAIAPARETVNSTTQTGSSSADEDYIAGLIELKALNALNEIETLISDEATIRHLDTFRNRKKARTLQDWIFYFQAQVDALAGMEKKKKGLLAGSSDRMQEMLERLDKVLQERSDEGEEHE